MDALFDLNSLIIQAINFAIIAVVLRKFFFVPYMQYLEQEMLKRKELEKNLSDAHQLKSDALAEAEAVRDSARKDASMIRDEIVANAKTEASQLISQAQKEIDSEKKRNQESIEVERENIKRELKDHVLDVALTLNRKLFSGKEVQKEFLEKNLPSSLDA